MQIHLITVLLYKLFLIIVCLLDNLYNMDEEVLNLSKIASSFAKDQKKA